MKHQGHIRDDPAVGISIKTGGRYDDENSEVDIPSDREMRDIYGAADIMGKKNDFMEKSWARYRPMIYLAGFSGMRPSEYRGLAWPHVFEDGVNVRQRADKTGIIGPVKSRAGKRTIYLPQLVTDMIYAWEDRCPNSDHDLVFPTRLGTPQQLGKFRRGAWLPLMREAGLMTTDELGGQKVGRSKYTPYALRHYFASKLIEQGKDLKFIQQTMGHSRIEITLNVYGHLLKDNEDAKKETAEALATEILGNPCGKFVAKNGLVILVQVEECSAHFYLMHNNLIFTRHNNLKIIQHDNLVNAQLYNLKTTQHDNRKAARAPWRPLQKNWRNPLRF